jgi:hypothetical protein
MRQQSLVLMISFILLGMTAVHPPFTPLNSVSASKAPTTENITSYLPPGGICRLPGDKIISDDGQYALVQCFYSLNHPHNGLYLLNMAAKTTNVLKDVPATADAAISANGVYVAVSFGGQIIRYDLMATPVASSAITITLTSRGALGNGVSSNPEISEDGRYVAFNSTASNLASDPNEQLDDRQDDIFLHDTQTRTTVLVTPQVPNYWSVGDPSLSPSGTQVLYSYVSGFTTS